MKIPTEVLEIWLEVMSDEELIRFRKRLQMNLKGTWEKSKREALIELFTSEIKRRDNDAKQSKKS